MFLNPFSSCLEKREEKKKIKEAKKMITELDERESEIEDKIKFLEEDIDVLTRKAKEFLKAGKKESAKMKIKERGTKQLQLRDFQNEQTEIIQQRAIIQMTHAAEQRAKTSVKFSKTIKRFVSDKQADEIDKATGEMEDFGSHKNEIEMRLAQLYKTVDSSTGIEEFNLDEELEALAESIETEDTTSNNNPIPEIKVEQKTKQQKNPQQKTSKQTEPAKTPLLVDIN